MKIPTSPLLFTPALSSSTLAYPTSTIIIHSPNPNHEKSPLLGETGGGDEASWGIHPDRMQGKLGRRWSTSHLARVEKREITICRQKAASDSASGCQCSSSLSNWWARKHRFGTAQSGHCATLGGGTGLLGPVTGAVGATSGLLNPLTGAVGAASGLLNPVTGVVGSATGLLNLLPGAAGGVARSAQPPYRCRRWSYWLAQPRH